MRTNRRLREFLSLALMPHFFTSCASTTLIKTEEPEVKVYADGNFLGVTPITYSDTKVTGSNTVFTLKKAGCAEQQTSISRNEQFQVGPFIGGLFVLVPFLWTMGYIPERTFSFECQKKS